MSSITDSVKNLRNNDPPPAPSIGETKETIRQLEIFYNNTGGYLLGYSGKEQICKEWVGIDGKEKPWYQHLLILIMKILGVSLTAFALQLGSNYWFDLLNKVVNLRATGKKPDENIRSK